MYMIIKKSPLTIAALLCGGILNANNMTPSSQPQQAELNTKSTFQDVLQTVIARNTQFAEKTPNSHFHAFKDVQTPRATVVMCADSRVQMHAFNSSPENDFFVVRNIGNQVLSNPGSIEFGINNLKTPVLFIVGHSGCGAIQAARSDYSQLSPDIKRELNKLDVKDAEGFEKAVLVNVNNQVEAAKSKFSERVSSGQLIIVGGVYDFRNDYGLGEGHFIITNLNGETDPKEIEASPYFEKVKDAKIGA